MKQNWLTWNTDRPQRASKQGLAFQVNVRNASTVRNGTETGVLFPLRTDSKTVAQLMWVGVGYNGGVKCATVLERLIYWEGNSLVKVTILWMI